MDSVVSQMPATHHLLSSVFNLMLYSHLRLGLSNGLFPLGFVTKIALSFSSVAYELCVLLSYTPLAVTVSVYMK